MIAKTAVDAAIGLVDRLADDESELVTVLVGADAATSEPPGSRSTSRLRIHRSRSRCTRATSRCTRTSSASSRWSVSRTVDPARACRAPVSELRAVGPKLGRLAEVEIRNILDLLQHYPRRYHDRTKRAEIAELTMGEEATVFAEVKKIRGFRTRQGRAMVEAEVFDGSSYLRVVFFNQRWREKQLPEGTEAAFFGRVEYRRSRLQMTNPIVDILDRVGENTGAIVPVYPQSGKAEVFTWQLRKLVAACLQKTKPRGFAEPLDTQLLDDRGLVDRTRVPGDPSSRRATTTGAQQNDSSSTSSCVCRSGWWRASALEQEQTGIRHAVDGRLVESFHGGLPFTLTGDQQRAIDQIFRDLAAPAPMHRLLQGDVGSGKTVVALSALLVAVQGGYQGALMAPTEVLAEQHYLVAASSRSSRLRRRRPWWANGPCASS